MPGDRPLAGRRFPLAVLLVWLACSGVMLALAAPRIASLAFRDPDDVMRLLEVRDWIAGQGWFDVTQYRVNPPLGAPMHWSRIVDLPIAGLILALRPLLGAALAERVALTLVPLLLLGGLFAAVAVAAERLGGRALAFLSAVLLALSAAFLVQFLPLRIDHHGWQIGLAGVALAATFDASPRRGGIIAGAALAIWLRISTEGLPFAALWGVCFGCMFLADPRQWPRLSGFLWTLAGLSALLLAAMRGPAWAEPSCDTLSPAYLPSLLVAPMLAALTHALPGEGGPWRRVAILGAGGAGALLSLALAGGACLAGPFSTLDPLVHRHWYLQIMEGRPIWEQGGTTAGVILLPSLAGLVGAVWAAREAPAGPARRNWIVLAGLTIGGLLAAAMTARSLGMAHVIALPGNAFLLLRLYRPIRASGRAAVRIVATVALAGLTPLGLSAFAALVTPAAEPAARRDPAASACPTAAGLAPLNRLEPGVVLAPLDISPNILLRTRHSVVGTSHHRNRAGMRAVIATFVLPEAQARAALMSTRATWLAWCPDQNETRKYRKASRAAFINDLAAGRVPRWLTPLPGSTALRLYRVNRLPADLRRG